jgi:serine/threonine-protein kinase
VFRAHVDLCTNGWVASDFYDGAMIYDFDLHQIRLVDLDMYRQGPFINEMGRMFGSTRFMAPEEFMRGARIDETTTVFTMGRCITVFLADRDKMDNPTVLSEFLSIADRACQDDRTKRWQSMSDLFDAWMNAIEGTES